MAQPVAVLSMYDFAHVRDATDALWAAMHRELQARGVAAPEALSRPQDPWPLWRDPGLVLGQTCGYPFVSRLRSHVQLLGAPDFGAIPGRPGWYNSVIVGRADDPRGSLAAYRGATLAFNEPGSQSGFRALMHKVATEIGEVRFFGRCVTSGGHAVSAKMVSQGEADIASLDCVSWRHIQAEAPDLNLRVIAETDPTPGLPYITAAGQDAERIVDAVAAAIEGLGTAEAEALGLVGFWRAQPEDYEVIAARAAVAAHTADLHLS